MTKTGTWPELVRYEFIMRNIHVDNSVPHFIFTLFRNFVINDVFTDIKIHNA